MLIPLLIAAVVPSFWPHQTLSKMSVEEKVGQLFVVPACPSRGEDHRDDLQFLIQQYHIGGVLLQEGSPRAQIDLINELSTSTVPLLRFADAEWGVSMRLNSALRFPKNFTLGAIQNLSLLSRFGSQVGWECAQVGLDINLAPVVDVNTNPLNPVIGMRSFGGDTAEVSRRGTIVMQAMQEAGTWACAKHFPGHGDTAVDSHLDLPTITQLALAPFETLVHEGVACIMTSHLSYKNEVVTFSRPLVEGTLRQKWGFEGLIVTDDLTMGALTKYASPGEIAVKAFFAGHDILLYGDHRPEVVDRILREDIPTAFGAILQAVQNGTISKEALNRRVLRILKAKRERGLVETFSRPQNLMTSEAKALKKELYRSAMTLVSNELFPLQPGPITIAQFGSSARTFTDACGRYATFDSPSAPVIIALYEVSPKALAFIKTVQQKKLPYALVLFTNPYKLLELGEHPTILVAYEDDPDAAEAAASVIFGQMEAKGVLPFSLR